MKRSPTKRRRNPLVYDVLANVLGNIAHERLKAHLRTRTKTKRRRR